MTTQTSDEEWQKAYKSWRSKVEANAHHAPNVCDLCSGEGNLFYHRNGKLIYIECPVCIGNGVYRQHGPKEIKTQIRGS